MLLHVSAHELTSTHEKTGLPSLAQPFAAGLYLGVTHSYIAAGLSLGSEHIAYHDMLVSRKLLSGVAAVSEGVDSTAILVKD